MRYQSLNEKLSIVSQLIEIAKSDGVVNIAEVSYVFFVAQQLGVTQLELTRLFDKAPIISPPIELKSRVEQFHRCIILTLIDNNIHDSEIEKLEEIAGDLRLPLGPSEDIMKQIRKKSNELITLSELLNLYGIS